MPHIALNTPCLALSGFQAQLDSLLALDTKSFTVKILLVYLGFLLISYRYFMVFHLEQQASPGRSLRKKRRNHAPWVRPSEGGRLPGRTSLENESPGRPSAPLQPSALPNDRWEPSRTRSWAWNWLLEAVQKQHMSAMFFCK